MCKPTRHDFQGAKPIGTLYKLLRALQILVKKCIIQCDSRIVAQCGQQMDVFTGGHLESGTTPQVAEPNQMAFIDEWNTGLGLQGFECCQDGIRPTTVIPYF